MTPLVTVYFTCPGCGIVYSAIQKRGGNHSNTSGTFDCEQCGTLVHHWAGLYDYIEWRIASLLRPPPDEQ
ncbi:hypothetical protein [Bradyrhizobium sp. CCBAU 53421]|uniref:hypothetical protein n=1 Tax=Bradyrhizobium sp. CCBAU 53421 TaxID=1325120 RepID=UPI00188D0014|nr:hypothetical protein [Bradyrhizobium sp. CCBAU 53421]